MDCQIKVSLLNVGIADWHKIIKPSNTGGAVDTPCHLVLKTLFNKAEHAVQSYAAGIGGQETRGPIFNA